MDSLVFQANRLLVGCEFKYSFCGGFAIDLFLIYETRVHRDIDISTFPPLRNKIILYMQLVRFDVYEMLAGVKTHIINAISDRRYIKQNIF